jgi:molecular chaperone DnaJ
MSRNDCFRVLGISPQSSEEEIKTRFRSLARRYHPDRNPLDSKAGARFRKIAEAYETICRLKSRQPFSHEGGAKNSARCGKKFYGSEDFIFAREDLLAELFGQDPGNAYFSSQAGPDFRYDLQISFAAAMLGIEKEIEFPRLQSCSHCQATGLQPGSVLQTCPLCKGKGRSRPCPGLLSFGPVCQQCQGKGRVITQPCSHCGGSGALEQIRRYSVPIPPGVKNGTRLRIQGEGGEGFRYGPPGHLFVVIHVDSDPFFTRIGHDLYCNLEVSRAQARLGDKIEIPTIKGKTILALPRGTRSGDIFRLVGLGVPQEGYQSRGDQVIVIRFTNSQSLDLNHSNQRMEIRGLRTTTDETVTQESL